MSDKDLEGLAAREVFIDSMNKSDKSISHTQGKYKYTEIRAHNICNNISQGMPLRVAAVAEGISEASLHRWRKEIPEFAEMVEQAIAVSEAKLIQKLSTNEDWRAAAWILERRFPEHWTKKEHIDMNVSRSEGLDEIKMMIEQTDHLLGVDRTIEEEDQDQD